MDIEDIIIDWLKAHNYDGLCEPESDCGCGLDDMFPGGSGCPYNECQPAKRRTCPYCGQVGYYTDNDKVVCCHCHLEFEG